MSLASGTFSPRASSLGLPHARLSALWRLSPAKPLATSITLAFADTAAVLAARWLAVFMLSRVHASSRGSSDALNDFYFPLSLALLVALFAAFGLYTGGGLSPVEELRRLTVATALVALFLTAAVFFWQDAPNYSRKLFVISGLLTAALAPCCRALTRRLLARRSWWGVPVVVFGAGSTARNLVESLKKQPAIGLKPVACLDDDASKHGECCGVPVTGPLSLAPEMAAAFKVRYALVAMPGVDREQLLNILERWGAAFTHLIVIPNLFGMASLWVSTRDLGGVLGLELRQNLLIPLNRWLKRAIDLIAATLLGMASLPILALAAVWIKIVSPGPAFYHQPREGERGRVISIPKLRTMYPDAESKLAAHLAASPAAAIEWQRHFKLKDDPRVLPGIGRILRHTSLDELPQIWSVLKGEMSLVGPRPFPGYHVSAFDAEFRVLRNRVRPGLTGLWQVSERSDGDLKAQQALDTYYIRNWSLWLDFYILAQTVRAVLFPRGAY